MNYERIGVEEQLEMDEQETVDDPSNPQAPEDGQLEMSIDDEELTEATEESEHDNQAEEDDQDPQAEKEDQTDSTETQNDNAIPPVSQIRTLLSEFEMKVPVWGLTVFTVDGYILAHRLFYDGMPENIEVVASSMSAGLITISEDFIRLVNASSQFGQVLVDANDENNQVHFSILLKNVADNVMLTIIFPSSVQLGLVTFEVENLSNAIREIVGLWDVKLHEETVT